MRCFVAISLPIILTAALAGGSGPTRPGGEWVPLFSGESVEHWRGARGTSFPAGYWEVREGCLKTVPARLGRDIVSRAAFDNFDLRFEWKVSPGGNSGVKYLVDESVRDPYYGRAWGSAAAAFGAALFLFVWSRRRGRVAQTIILAAAIVIAAAALVTAYVSWQYFGHTVTGLEMQLLDDERHPNGENPLKRAGALYGVYEPSASVTRPAGQWNTGRVVVQGRNVEHWINGERVVAYVLGSEEWRERIGRGKYGGLPGIGSKGERHIVLQHHFDEVWFRNVRVMRLPDEQAGGDQS